MSNPYLFEGPAVVSFSGGRTSGYMVHEIVKAHDGKVPENIFFAFANTGKEREETLRFVYECESRWGVKVNWLEWRKGGDGFEEVGFNSASRDGEPFEALIRSKKRLPNSFERWCTEYLKVRTLIAFAKSNGLQYGQYNEVVGLRNDEGHRILRSLENANFVRKKVDGKKIMVPRHPPRRMLFPLAKGKIVKLDVMKFWLGETARFPSSDLPQGFDLVLADHEGNCDFCFLKGKGLRKRIIRDRPSVPGWWSRMEELTDGWFDSRNFVRDLVRDVRDNPSFFDADEIEEYDTECGLHCVNEEEDGNDL